MKIIKEKRTEQMSRMKNGSEEWRMDGKRREGKRRVEKREVKEREEKKSEEKR